MAQTKRLLTLMVRQAGQTMVLTELDDSQIKEKLNSARVAPGYVIFNGTDGNGDPATIGAWGPDVSGYGISEFKPAGPQRVQAVHGVLANQRGHH